MLPLAAIWAIPWVKKLVIYAALAGTVLYALRIWGNRQWDAGEQSGRVAAFKEAEKGLLKQQLEIEKAVNDMRQQLIIDRSVLLAQQSETARTRQAISKALETILEAVRAAQVKSDADIDRIPGSELDGALRDQSNKLAGTPK